VKENILRVSVCLALYNGIEYIEEQIKSVLAQLTNEDELIVVDDCSRDGSGILVENFRDPRIRFLRNEKNLGVVSTFERALRGARGDYIFLCDQDDIWAENKVARTLEVFKSTGALCVLSDALLVNHENESLGQTSFQWRNSKPGLIRNWLQNCFMGCTMAFRKDLLLAAMPFPSSLYMHDQWLGMIATIAGHVVFLPELLVRYRRHAGNVTSLKRSATFTMVRRRLSFAAHFALRIPRALQLRSNFRRVRDERL